jgi:hypothetical protein
MIKINKTLGNLLALLLLISTACTNGDELLTTTPTEESTAISASLEALNSKYNLAASTYDNDVINNIIFDFGFDFVYPITLAYNNESIATVDNFEELNTILEASNPNLFVNEIAFPFDVEVFNYNSKTIEINKIEDEQAFLALVDSVEIGTPNDCICTEEYSPVFVEVTTPSGGGMTLTYSNACLARCNGFSQSDFIDNDLEITLPLCYSGNVDCFEFDYPITILVDNTRQVTINSEQQLFDFTYSNYDFEFIYPFSIQINGDTSIMESKDEYQAVLNDCYNPIDIVCLAVYDPVYIETVNLNGVEKIISYGNACEASRDGYSEEDFLNNDTITFTGEVESFGDFSIHKMLSNEDTSTSLNITSVDARERLNLATGIVKSFLLTNDNINLSITNWDMPLDYGYFSRDYIDLDVPTPTIVKTFMATRGSIKIKVLNVTEYQSGNFIETLYEVNIELENVLFESNDGEQKFIKNLTINDVRLGWSPG